MKNDTKKPLISCNFLKKKIFKSQIAIFSLMAILATTNSLIAQKFNGVELNQNKSIVINQFIAKGFVIESTEPNYVTLKGKIVNEQVTLTIYPTLTSKLVRKIVVFYPSVTDWETAKTYYFRKVSMLTSKYGEILDHTELFESPYYEGDGYEFQAFDQNKATYISIWGNMVDHPNVALSVELICTPNLAIPVMTYEISSNVAKHQQELLKAQENVY